MKNHMRTDSGGNITYHVKKTGSDKNSGAASAPLLTIQEAANRAHPGDTITVYEGIYREYIDPPRGGTSDESRITYQAAPGETVQIKGSEVVDNWVHVDGGVWKASVPNDLFGGFNPFANLLGGDWFFPQNRQHHSGQVYINDRAINEAAAMDELFRLHSMRWFAINAEWETTIWANFGAVDPNKAYTEINVRQAVFYPSRPRINYLTVRGFTLSQAATPWSPPTTEQIGLIGVNWSKGWVIENNTISHSRCTGITLGKFHDRRDGTIQYGFNAHFQAVKRVLERGDWTPDNIGHHVIRNNRISHCEQSGIVGSHGGAFCRIEGNVIHDIHVRKLFGGFEQAGIKLHAPIDTVISNNLIFNCHMGIWLDWMTQGARISNNTMYGNHSSFGDIFIEISHGPVLVDNNILLSDVSILDSAQGNAYVHNLIGGQVRQRAESARQTQYFDQHGTQVCGFAGVDDGDDRFYNNILLHPAGLASYDKNKNPVWIDRNVYLRHAQSPKLDRHALVDGSAEDRFRVEKEDGCLYLHLPLKKVWQEVACARIHTDMLGQAQIPKQNYENPDGSPIVINQDAHGKARGSTPFPGPFELTEDTETIQIWPLRKGALKVTAQGEKVEVQETEPR